MWVFSQPAVKAPEKGVSSLKGSAKWEKRDEVFLDETKQATLLVKTRHKYLIHDLIYDKHD